MQFIHAREHFGDGDAVQVDCDTECNVMITSDGEFARFERGEECTYRGGFYRSFPVIIAPAHAGYWNITIDVGEGYEASVECSITVIRRR